MTVLNAPADPASERPDDPGAPVAAPPGRVLDSAWIAASSPQLTITLAVLLALTLALAALIPQLPAGLDAASAGRWVSTTAARYARFGPFLASSGLFNVLAGPWIVTLLSVTAFHLLLRCVNQAHRLASPRPALPAAPQGLPFELVSLPVQVAEIEPRLQALVAGRRRAACRASDPDSLRPRIDAYVERGSWAAPGPLLTYAGPLLVILGLLWNTVGGFRVTDIPLTPGRPVQPARAGGLALSLIKPGGPDGLPGVVALTRGAQTRHAWLDYARPAIWGSVWVNQRASGPALRVSATRDGAAAPLQSLQEDTTAEPGASVDQTASSLYLRFGQNESEQAFSIAGSDLVFRVVSYESLVENGITRPVFLIEGYRGTDPVPGLNELVENQGTIEWEGVTLLLQREAHVVVDLAGLPGLPLLVLGGMLLLLGTGVTAWGGLTRIWVNAAAERDGALLAVRVAAPAEGQVDVGRIARLLAGVPSSASIPADDHQRGVVAPAAVLAWRPERRLGIRRAAWALVAAGLLAGLAYVLLRASGPLPAQARIWLFGLHLALALLALGAVLVAAVDALRFVVRGSRASEVLDPTFPAERLAMRGRPGDPGRLAALSAFPLLTASALAGAGWGLVGFGAPIRAAASEMWLLAAWLLVAAYLHATSGWRPPRVPVWAAALLICAALASGIAAVIALASLVIA